VTARTLPAASWLLASILLEAASVVLLAATVGWIGSTLYAGLPVNWLSFALLMATMVVLRAIASVSAGGFGAWLGTRYRRRALIAAMAASPDRVRSIGPGAALTKAMDVESVGDFFARASAGWILGVIEVAAAVVLALALGLPMLVTVSLGISVSLLVALAAALVRARSRWRTARLAVTTQTVEGLLSLETTQVFDRPYDDPADTATRLATYRTSAMRMDRVAIGLTILPGCALVATLVSVFVAGGDSRQIAIGIGVSLLGASGLERLTSVAVDAVAAMDAAQGLRELDAFRVASPTSTGSAFPTPADAHHGNRLSGSVNDEEVLLHASRVTSTFAPGQGLVDPIDLIVREGDRLLVSAASGFGKTTLGEVLAGEREPTTGSVWRRDGVTIARVLQADDDHMFGNSLMFNVACGVEWPPSRATQDRVRSLLDELGLSELVGSMPAGLAQPIGEGGWRLSTGERTRVSLASAMLREPDVLILDESIATLDGDTRERVLAACIRHSKSTVLFAHWD